METVLTRARDLIVVLCMFTLMVLPSQGNSAAGDYGESASGFLAQASGPTKVDTGLADLLYYKKVGNVTNDPRLADVMARIERGGGVRVGIQFDHTLDDSQIAVLERDLGVRFNRVIGDRMWQQNGLVPHLPDHIYLAEIPLDLNVVQSLKDLPYVRQIATGMWPPEVPALNVSVPATRADLVWPLKDSADKNLTGKGVKIAVRDTGIDVFHPDFFSPDPAVAPFNWVDVNGSGALEPGTDVVDLNRDGQAQSSEDLKFFDAAGGGQSGVFETNVDWLYNDDNHNGSRDFGPTGYDNANLYPAFGERIFVVDDTNDNNRLDVGEQLIELRKSKIYKVYSTDVEHTRDSTVQPYRLIDTPRDTSSHGTGVAGVLVAGMGGYRKYTGVAYDPLSFTSQPETGGLMLYDTGASSGDLFTFLEWARLGGGERHPERDSGVGKQTVGRFDPRGNQDIDAFQHLQHHHRYTYRKPGEYLQALSQSSSWLWRTYRQVQCASKRATGRSVH